MVTTTNRGDQQLRDDEVMPSYVLDMLVRLLEEKGNRKGMFRKEIAWELIQTKPIIAKYMATGKIPFNLLFKKSVLRRMKEGMNLKEQRRILKSAQVDSKGLCFINLDKVSGVKRRVERREGKVVFTSSRHSGIQLLKYAPHNNIAQKMYDILSYNAGQADTWKAHSEKFNEQCGDRDLVKRIKLYTKLAMDKGKLSDLRDDVKVYTDTI